MNRGSQDARHFTLNREGHTKSRVLSMFQVVDFGPFALANLGYNDSYWMLKKESPPLY